MGNMGTLPVRALCNRSTNRFIAVWSAFAVKRVGGIAQAPAANHPFRPGSAPKSRTSPMRNSNLCRYLKCRCLSAGLYSARGRSL